MSSGCHVVPWVPNQPSPTNRQLHTGMPSQPAPIACRTSHPHARVDCRPSQRPIQAPAKNRYSYSLPISLGQVQESLADPATIISHTPVPRRGDVGPIHRQTQAGQPPLSSSAASASGVGDPPPRGAASTSRPPAPTPGATARDASTTHRSCRSLQPASAAIPPSVAHASSGAVKIFLNRLRSFSLPLVRPGIHFSVLRQIRPPEP